MSFKAWEFIPSFFCCLETVWFLLLFGYRGCSWQYRERIVIIHSTASCSVHAVMRKSMKTVNLVKGGFTLVEIMIVVAIIGLLAAIAIPNFVKARSTTQQKACINNLRQIDSAKQQWALEMNQTTNSTPPVDTDIAPYLRSGSITNVLCPSGGTTSQFSDCYNIQPLTTAPTCKIQPSTHFLN